MARFTSANAASYGRRGGQRSHQRLEVQYADFHRRCLNGSATRLLAAVKTG